VFTRGLNGKIERYIRKNFHNSKQVVFGGFYYDIYNEMFNERGDLKYKIKNDPELKTGLVSFLDPFLIFKVKRSQLLKNLRLLRPTPSETRKDGVPTPNAELETHGGNLPAAVDILKRRHPETWQKVMRAMQAILPDLVDIKTDYTPTRTLGMYFQERGFGRP